MNFTPGVSVVICCYNGAGRLRETIKHLALQEVPIEIPWEVVLVDNCSTDDSAEIAKLAWREFNARTVLNVVKEPMLGLSSARATGFNVAKYEFVILCDDDNWLSSDYVKVAYQIMTSKDSVAALGGLGVPTCEVSPPTWLSYLNIYATGSQNESKNGKPLYGAGCVIRKSYYQRLVDNGFKSLLTDRKGIELSSGGDHELCYAFVLSGYLLWYDERLRFYHWISKDRLTWDYALKYANESVKCFDVLEAYKFATVFRARSFSYSFIKGFLYCVKEYLSFCVKKIFKFGDPDQLYFYKFKKLVFAKKIGIYFFRFLAIKNYYREIKYFKLRLQKKNNKVNHLVFKNL